MSTLNGHRLADDALLTKSEVAEWRAELANIETATAKLNARAMELGQLLTAASIIERVRAAVAATDPAPQLALEPIPAPIPVDAPNEVVAPASASLAEAIRRVVGQARVPMTPREIRNTIAHSPDAHLIGSVNYIYTAIAREAAKGDIIKHGDGYVPASQ